MARWFSMVLALCSVTSLAQAHFVYLIPHADGKSVQLVFSDKLAPDKSVPIAKVAATKVTQRHGGKDSVLKTETVGNALQANLAGDGLKVLFGHTDYGVVQKGESKPFRLHYHPKAIIGDAFAKDATIGKEAPIEIVPVRDEKRVKFLVLADGKPLADAEVFVRKPNAEANETVKTDAKGFTPAFTEAGRYGVVARLLIVKQGEHNGKKYDEIRHYATLVVDVTSLAVAGLDPVLLVQGKNVQGQVQFSVFRKGLTYQFADAANQLAFTQSPENYEIQRDGQCACSPNAKADPTVFTVYKDKIYAFFCTHCREEFLKEPEKYTQPPKLVAILLFEGVELLDFAGPGEAFSTAGFPFKVVTVAASAEPITSQGFLKVTPNYSIANCPKVDVLVIPGGEDENARKNPKLLEWVRQTSNKAELTLTVCTGAFILAETGLLDGKKATTHHAAVAEFKKKYTKVTVTPDQRFVDNGTIVTAAGVSAGIDAALHVLEKMLGKTVAEQAARNMEYRRQAQK